MSLLAIVTLSPTAREMRGDQAFAEWRARFDASLRPGPDDRQVPDSRGSSAWEGSRDRSGDVAPRTHRE